MTRGAIGWSEANGDWYGDGVSSARARAHSRLPCVFPRGLASCKLRDLPKSGRGLQQAFSIGVVSLAF